MLSLLRFWPLLPLLFVPFLYGNALLNLWGRWLNEAEYSYGALIPLISLYIISERWSHIRSVTKNGSLWGVMLLVLAVTLLWLGEASALFALQQISFVVFLLAFALAFWGTSVAKLICAPILILLFAIPPPYFFEVMLTARLQLLSSQLGVLFIKWMGMPVFLTGNVIDLGEVQLEVVEACSGLRFLYPLMSIGFILAYFYQAHIFKRLLVFLSTIPITIVMNSLRIAVTAFLVERYGLGMVQGWVHDAEGWVVFGGCLVFLFAEILLLERFTSRLPLSAILGLKSSSSTPVEYGRSEWRTLPVYLFFAVFCLAQVAVWQLHSRQSQQSVTTQLNLFPNRVGEWQGVPVPIGADVRDKLKFSDYLMLNFNRPGTVEPLNLYVAFYANQRSGESPHSPRVCIPGGGWEIESFRRTRLANMDVNRVVIVKEGQKQLVYYWFAERGQIVANEYFKKWLLLHDFVNHGRSDGALVRVALPFVDDLQLEDSEERVANFIAQVQPLLMTYLPGPSI